MKQSNQDAYSIAVDKQVEIYTAKIEGRSIAPSINYDADSTAEIVQTTYNVDKSLIEAVDSLAAHNEIDRDKLFRYLMQTAIKVLSDNTETRYKIANSSPVIKPGQAYKRG
jgi:hypothetical protein